MADRPSVHREVERKLRVAPDFPLLDLQGHGALGHVIPRQAFEMTAAYHDTEDLRLLRWGATLRRREGGPDEGWHLKLPVAGSDAGTRDELHLPLWAGQIGSVPAELADVVAPFARGARLIPVAWVHTIRTPSMLIGADGIELAELVDDLVRVRAGDHRVLAEFREIEVEARGPSDSGVIDRLAAILIEHGAEPSSASKAASALGPLAAAPPDITVPGIPLPQDPARAAIRAMISRHARGIVLADVAVRRALPNSVGLLHAATSQLSSLLCFLEPLLDAEWARTIQQELGWLASETGAIQETEILAERLHAHATRIDDLDASAALAIIDDVLGRRLSGARGGALAALRSERHELLLEDIVRASQDPPVTAAGDHPSAAVLPPLIAHEWRRLNRPARKLRKGADSGDWDRVRMRAERMRHVLDACSPMFPDHRTRLTRKLARATEVLGEQRTARNAQHVIREIAAHQAPTGMAAFALGRLFEQEVAYERESRQGFIRQWPSVRQVAKRSWFR